MPPPPAPGQVLQLIPRTEGDFLSPVIPAPAIASWGRVEVRTGDDAPSGDAGGDAQRQPRHARRRVERLGRR